MLLSCGSNAAAHLALGHANDVSVLTDTVPLPQGEILDLVSVSSHTLLLIRHHGRNNLYGIGTNSVGQLGRPCALRDEGDKQVFRDWRRLELVRELGGEEQEDDWEPVKIGSTWTSSLVVYRRLGVQGTRNSSAIEASSDMVVACGSNDFNELGRAVTELTRHISTTTPSSRPRVVVTGIMAGEEVEMLACGQRHVMLVITGGQGGQRVIGWGAGRKGELDIKTLSGAEAVPAETSRKGKGKALSRPSTYPPTTIDLPLEQDERIVDISLGASHSVVLTSHGRVLAWGSDAKGQIGATADLAGIKQISASWNGSYLVSTDGTLWSQGSNTHSQLLHEKDGLGGIVIPEDTTVERIVAGSEHLIVLVSRAGQHELWTGGWNEHGNLGLGDQIDRPRLEKVQIPAGEVKGIWAGCASTWVWIQ